MDPDPLALLAAHAPAGRVRHVERIPERAGIPVPWPAWAPDAVVERLVASGIAQPWAHQAAAAELAREGRSVVVATGTASGKTLAMWLPLLSGLVADEAATALYLSPTKALAHDQLRALRALDIPGVRAEAYDGDTPSDEREWIRAHGTMVFTNPDLVHRSLLPRHRSWARFLRGLRFVLIDEAHHYRGVFGSHVALVLRRLLRVAHAYGATPVVMSASATIADPGNAVSRLIGREAIAVTADASPRPPLDAVLWEPGEEGPTTETAGMLAALVDAGVRTLAFVRSRRGVEAVAMLARERLPARGAPAGAPAFSIAAYRGGYLAEERRALEGAFRDRSLVGLASTNALELGIDVTGLDAVLVSGWPGTRASLWQQWGRAGRHDSPALGVFIAREDPLDRYLLDHPDAIFREPVEHVVLDPDNPHVLGPHLLAAAAEAPITDDEVAEWFGHEARPLLDDAVARGLLRRRRTGWYWTSRESPAHGIDLRGEAGGPVRIVEDDTGRLLGTVERSRAPSSAHAGAVYVHQGATYVVVDLDLDETVAFVRPEEVDYSTTAAEIADYRILAVDQSIRWGDAVVCRGEVEVTAQVVCYLQRRLTTGAILGEHPLDLPARSLRTRGTWWTLSEERVRDLAERGADIAGAAHAAEHAAIGLLPLVATCDRWDIGGVSTELHPDTGLCTVLVYDGHPGGAGFADRGFSSAQTWLAATRERIADCRCEDGCPACIQSPKCGNGNAPLDKRGALLLLDAVLSGAPGSGCGPDPGRLLAG
ncbi:MAG: DEAD/DEAH box helicase [bacterium]